MGDVLSFLRCFELVELLAEIKHQIINVLVSSVEVTQGRELLLERQ